MELELAFHQLEPLGQTGVLRHWGELTATQRLQLMEQVEAIDWDLFQTHQRLLSENPPFRNGTVTPPSNVFSVDEVADRARGLELMKEGRIGCLVVAGGQGTRLQFPGPKGLFPITVIQEKSLFQLLFEKVLAASHQAERPLPIAVMTSPDNHEETLAYIEEHNAFGLEMDQVSFFCQESLPLLDHDGNLFLDSPYHIAQGPSGNGSSLQEFIRSGVWERWRARGVEFINWISIDNPLAAPFDASLLGFHARKDLEIVVKACSRRNATEKVGLLVERAGHLEVVEYTEIPEDIATAANEEGELLFSCANISQFSFSMDFVQVVGQSRLPWHLAHKAVPFLDDRGETVKADKPNAWKFEQFIFDHLPRSERAAALVYPRYQCFAPLKNAKGVDSALTVQAALQDYESELFSEVTRGPPPSRPFELDPCFYYPTDWLIEKWKGRSARDGGYIMA